MILRHYKMSIHSTTPTNNIIVAGSVYGVGLLRGALR
jgi:hypothetical protein